MTRYKDSVSLCHHSYIGVDEVIIFLFSNTLILHKDYKYQTSAKLVHAWQASSS